MVKVKKSAVVDNNAMYSAGVFIKTSFFDNAAFDCELIKPMKKAKIIEVFYCAANIHTALTEIHVIAHHPHMTEGERRKKLTEIAETIIGITE